MNAAIVRIRQLEERIVEDTIALRDASTTAEREAVAAHLIPLLDERDRLLGKVQAAA